MVTIMLLYIIYYYISIKQFGVISYLDTNIYIKIQTLVNFINKKKIKYTSKFIGLKPVLVSYVILFIITIGSLYVNHFSLYVIKNVSIIFYIFITILNINSLNKKYDDINYKIVILFLITVINIFVSFCLLFLDKSYLLYHLSRSSLLLLVYLIFKCYLNNILIYVDIDNMMEKITVYEMYYRYCYKYIYNILMYGPIVLIISIIFIIDKVNINLILILSVSYVVTVLNLARLSKNNLVGHNKDYLKNKIVYLITKRGYPGPETFNKIIPFTPRMIEYGYKSLGMAGGALVLYMVSESFGDYMTQKRVCRLRENICDIERSLVRSQQIINDLRLPLRNKLSHWDEHYCRLDIERHTKRQEELYEGLALCRKELLSLSVKNSTPLNNILQSINRKH